MSAAELIDQAVACTLPIYSSVEEATPDRLISLAELAALTCAPTLGPKLKAAAVTPYSATGKKKEHALQSLYHLLVIDHDHDGQDAAGIESIYDSFGVSFLAYTTSTHQRPDKQGVIANRWRVLVPLATPIDAAQYHRLACGLAYALGADMAQARAQQVFFTPNRIDPDQPYHHIDRLNRPHLDTDNYSHPLIDEALAGWQSLQRAKEMQAQAAVVKPRPVLSAEKAGIVGLILAAYNVRDLIGEDDYKRQGADYLSPTSSTGNAGVHIFERDGKEVCYSHHGEADPLSNLNHDGHALDAADVLCVLKYGGDFRAMISAEAEKLDQEGNARRQREFMQAKAEQEAAANQDAHQEPDQEAEQQPSQAGGLLEIPLDDVMSASLEPVRFALKPWLPRRHVTLFGGHGGIGKSSLALTMGAHVAAGLPFAGHSGDRVPVLFVSLEDEPSIVRLRLRRIIESYNLDPAMVLPGMRLLDGTQSFSALMTEGDGFNDAPVITKAFREIEQKSAGTGLVIIDNASDAFDANENSRRAVRAFVRNLAEIARKHDTAVVLLAHIDKAAARNGSQGNSYSGSTAWHNSARSRLALAEQEGAIILTHEKANLTACADPLRLSFVGGVLMPESGANGSNLTGAHFDQAEIIRAFKAAAEAGQRINASLTPGAYCAMKSLELLPDEAYPKAFRSKAGASRAARAIAALKGAGRIKQVSYKTDDRKTKLELVLVEGSAQTGDECADDDA